MVFGGTGQAQSGRLIYRHAWASSIEQTLPAVSYILWGREQSMRSFFPCSQLPRSSLSVLGPAEVAATRQGLLRRSCSLLVSVADA